MDKHLKKYCDIFAWCLMPNHFHWMIRVRDEINDTRDMPHPLVRSIATLLSSYTQAINKQEKRSGSLFRQSTKAIELGDPEYALICFLYIHQNPLMAGLVKKHEQWKYSSYRDFAGFRNESLCNIEMAQNFLELPKDNNLFRKMSHQTIPEHFLNKIK